jgi:CubicO group peptidase (beta-lactamase class C family)
LKQLSGWFQQQGGGITGPLFWVDPQARLVAVLMAQSPRAMLGLIWRQTRTMVYQAMVD